MSAKSWAVGARQPKKPGQAPREELGRAPGNYLYGLSVRKGMELGSSPVGHWVIELSTRSESQFRFLNSSPVVLTKMVWAVESFWRLAIIHAVTYP